MSEVECPKEIDFDSLGCWWLGGAKVTNNQQGKLRSSYVDALGVTLTLATDSRSAPGINHPPISVIPAQCIAKSTLP